jgi:hypothetical protein
MEKRRSKHGGFAGIAGRWLGDFDQTSIQHREGKGDWRLREMKNN